MSDEIKPVVLNAFGNRERCHFCAKPAVTYVNVAANAAGSVPSTWKPACEDHSPKPVFVSVGEVDALRITESQLQLIIDAAGLCQSEANRWDGRPSCQKTADHWQHAATELQATYLLAHGLIERVAELEATAARRLELLRPFATAYDAWVAADSDTAIEITPEQARTAAAEVAADSP